MWLKFTQVDEIRIFRNHRWEPIPFHRKPSLSQRTWPYSKQKPWGLKTLVTFFRDKGKMEKQMVCYCMTCAFWRKDKQKSKIWWDFTVDHLHFMSPRHGHCQEGWYASGSSCPSIHITLISSLVHKSLNLSKEGVSRHPHGLQQEKEKKNKILAISKDSAVDVSSMKGKGPPPTPLLLARSILKENATNRLRHRECHHAQGILSAR